MRARTLLFVSLLSACAADLGVNPDSAESARLRVEADVSGTSAATVVVEVTSGDITDPLGFNLDIVNGVAAGTIEVPAGIARTIAVRVFDAAGIETHAGTVTIDVVAGTNPTVTITLAAAVGQVPIVVRIGTFLVRVTPASDTLAPGDTARLRATVIDAAGDTVSVRVRWATLDPAVATVDTTGLVAARAAGHVQIVATHAGVGAAADILVSGGGGGGGGPNFALDFSGTAHVTVPDHPDLDLDSTWTIEAWIKPRNAAGGFQHLVSKWGGCATASYTLSINLTRARSGIASCANGTQVLETPTALVNGQWQHVAVTLDRDTLRLHVNGVELATLGGSQRPLNTTTPVTFGREGIGLWQYEGLMDEIRIWRVGRTAAQIQSTMGTRLAGTEPGLVGYWPFDEGSGDVANDATGRGHAGRLGSAVGPDGSDPGWTVDGAPVN